jgi:hypothetical protein
MGLADTGRTEEDDVLAVGDIPALGKLLDPLLVDRGLEGEVERLERLDVRELRERRAERDVLLLLRGDLLRQYLVQEVGVGDVVLGRFLESCLDPVVDPVETEVAKVVLDVVEALRILSS